MFIIIAILGGLVGSAYVWVNEHLTMMRKKFWAGKNPAWRIVEALVIVCTILTMFFFIPMLFECKHLPDWAGDADDSHRKLAGYHSLVPIQYNCEAGYYNEMATLLLTPQETTILQLYSRNTYEYFDIPTLAVFTVFFFFCAVTAYGIAVPAGLFIPSMMIGAGMGRLFGEIVNGISGEHTVVRRGGGGEREEGRQKQKRRQRPASATSPNCARSRRQPPSPLALVRSANDPLLLCPGCFFQAAHSSFALASLAQDPGFYGLIGAAAVLGGITRMTISLTVIMVEITNNINYMLPIMLSVAISKAVGDHFTESLYDVHMELAGIPYIESEPPQVRPFRDRERSERKEGLPNHPDYDNRRQTEATPHAHDATPHTNGARAGR
jgi:H+/Cl- antiporter ClcA